MKENTLLIITQCTVSMLFVAPFIALHRFVAGEAMKRSKDGNRGKTCSRD